ncbi:MAG: hypothetical protein IKG23_05010 [Clostridia bacterium]|nr:hypothetical protein [Clostridia bacterium]
MGKSAKTETQKTPRRKWHERTAEQDIRYRGPLNYQHFQILGWLCIVASQASLILSLGARLGKLPDSWAGLTGPLTYMSWLSLPFLLIANFAQIMNGQKSYRFLLIKNFCAAGAVWGIYAFFLNRYVLGTIDMINDGTITGFEALSQIVEKAAPTGVLCFNIFIDLFLCTLVMFFLNYKPTRIFKGKTRFIFRSFALLPVVYEVGCIVLKVMASRKEVTVSPFFYPLFTVKPTMTFVLFIVLAMYIKTRELRFRRHGKSHEEYKAFLNTNKNSWDFSRFLAIALVVIALADLAVLLTVTARETANMTEEAMNTYYPTAVIMGFGDSIVLIFLAPLVLLFSYTRKPKNAMVGLLVPVSSFALIMLLYLEAGHQAIPMFDLPKFNLQEMLNPPAVTMNYSAEDLQSMSGMTVEELLAAYPELAETLKNYLPAETVPAENAPSETVPAEEAVPTVQEEQ